MKTNIKTIRLVKVLLLLFVSINALAIDLLVENAQTSAPGNIATVGVPFTVSLDIINSAQASSQEDAQSIKVTIDVGGFTNNRRMFGGANVSFISMSESPGWTCTPDTDPVATLDCNATFTPTQFVPGPTPEVLSFQLRANDVINSSTQINFFVEDTILINENSGAFDSVSFTAVLPPPEFQIK